MAARALSGFLTYVRRHHLGLLALFIALGGTAYAAQHATAPKNSVVTRSIKKNAVTGAKVKDHSLTGADLKQGTLNATSLGGSPASDYVKGATAIPGGDLAGTYTAPLVRVGRAAAVPNEVKLGFGVNPEPSVSIDVPPSGLAEALAWGTLAVSGGSGTAYAELRIDGKLVEQVIAVNSGVGFQTRYSRQESSFVGTTNPQAAQWIPIFTTPGQHTVSLQVHVGGPATSFVAKDVHLLVRAFS
jgi:hypothetical protein